MALHKILVDDFYDDTFALLALHCNLEDYRIAYLINKHLNLNLSRINQDIDFEYVKARFSLFEYEDQAKQITWNLFSNICKKEEESLVSSGMLFEDQPKTMKTFNLVPEFKKVNYLLKIDGDGANINERPLLNKLNEIPQVVTAYSIDVSTLKSRDNLIFK